MRSRKVAKRAYHPTKTQIIAFAVGQAVAEAVVEHFRQDDCPPCSHEAVRAFALLIEDAAASGNNRTVAARLRCGGIAGRFRSRFFCPDGLFEGLQKGDRTALVHYRFCPYCRCETDSLFGVLPRSQIPFTKKGLKAAAAALKFRPLVKTGRKRR